ncbi:hypothetical protein DVB88_15060 [Tsukamurella pulmonis]|nr:hypothetical protein DVB88_15060 [Tsukamurella pulmonis]
MTDDSRGQTFGCRTPDTSIGPTYRLPWVTAWPVALLPGMVLALARRTRRAGYAYAIAVLIVGGLVTLLFAPFDWLGLRAHVIVVVHR